MATYQSSNVDDDSMRLDLAWIWVIDSCRKAVAGVVWAVVVVAVETAVRAQVVLAAEFPPLDEEPTRSRLRCAACLRTGPFQSSLLLLLLLQEGFVDVDGCLDEGLKGGRRGGDRFEEFILDLVFEPAVELVNQRRVVPTEAFRGLEELVGEFDDRVCLPEAPEIARGVVRSNGPAKLVDEHGGENVKVGQPRRKRISIDIWLDPLVGLVSKAGDGEVDFLAIGLGTHRRKGKTELANKLVRSGRRRSAELIHVLHGDVDTSYFLQDTRNLAGALRWSCSGDSGVVVLTNNRRAGDGDGAGTGTGTGTGRATTGRGVTARRHGDGNSEGDGLGWARLC